MIAGFSVVPGNAQSLSGEGLANALRQGGYVLVMRHANLAGPATGYSATPICECET